MNSTVAATDVAAADAARLTRMSNLRTLIRTSQHTLEWRIAMVDLAIEAGQLPANLPVDAVSLLHPTTLQ